MLHYVQCTCAGNRLICKSHSHLLARHCPPQSTAHTQNLLSPEYKWPVVDNVLINAKATSSSLSSSSFKVTFNVQASFFPVEVKRIPCYRKLTSNSFLQNKGSPAFQIPFSEPVTTALEPLNVSQRFRDQIWKGTRQNYLQIQIGFPISNVLKTQ